MSLSYLWISSLFRLRVWMSELSWNHLEMNYGETNSGKAWTKAVYFPFGRLLHFQMEHLTVNMHAL